MLLTSSNDIDNDGRSSSMAFVFTLISLTVFTEKSSVELVIHGYPLIQNEFGDISPIVAPLRVPKLVIMSLLLTYLLSLGSFILLISTTRFHGHGISGFASLCSQYKTIWLSVNFVLDVWYCFSELRTTSPVCALSVAAISSARGCVVPSCTNFDLLKRSRRENFLFFN